MPLLSQNTNLVVNGLAKNRLFINGSLKWERITGEVFNPEAGLTSPLNIPEGNSDVDINSQNTSYVFAANINFPAVPTGASFWYEKGGSGQGMYWGIVTDGSDYYFRLRAGDGGVNIAAGATYPSGVIGKDIPFNLLPASVKGAGNYGRIVAELHPNNGGSATVAVWIDGVLLYDITQDPAENERLEGGAGGSHITGSSINVNGESGTAWEGESDGQGISVYVDQLVDRSGGVVVSGEPLGLSFTTSGACANYNPNSTTLYYTDTDDFETANVIYTDEAKTVVAPVSYYSNGNKVRGFSDGSFFSNSNCS